MQFNGNEALPRINTAGHAYCHMVEYSQLLNHLEYFDQLLLTCSFYLKLSGHWLNGDEASQSIGLASLGLLVKMLLNHKVYFDLSLNIYAF